MYDPTIRQISTFSKLTGDGGHINPAVSLAFCTVGRFPWWKLPFYALAQYIGAFLGSAVAFGVYYGK